MKGVRPTYLAFTHEGGGVGAAQSHSPRWLSESYGYVVPLTYPTSAVGPRGPEVWLTYRYGVAIPDSGGPTEQTWTVPRSTGPSTRVVPVHVHVTFMRRFVSSRPRIATSFASTPRDWTETAQWVGGVEGERRFCTS